MMAGLWPRLAARGLGTLVIGWAASQDQLPLCTQTPTRGEGDNGFWRKTGSSSHPVRLRSPPQHSHTHRLTPSLTTHCIPMGPSRPLIPQLLSLVQETLHPGSAPALTCPVTPLHHVTHSNYMQAPKLIMPLASTHVVLSSLNVFPDTPVLIKFDCIL